MKPIKIGHKLVPVYQIPVQVLENENDYEFVFVDAGGGKKVMTVF